MAVKQIGLIDNLSDIDSFRAGRFAYASAAEIMRATGGNTGNVAYVQGVRTIIANPAIRVEWGHDPSWVNKNLSHLVICCANQIGRHADLTAWAAYVEKIEIPVTLIGLGAQADSLDDIPLVPEGTWTFLRHCAERSASRAANISVRGEFTKNLLERNGIKASADGCPSLQISPDDLLGQSILRRQGAFPARKVAVSAGNPWHSMSRALEPILVDLVNQFDGEYFLQHPESMLQFLTGDPGDITDETYTAFLKAYGGRFDRPQLTRWYQKNAVVMIDAPNWIRRLRQFDLALGPRYHGVALAIQAGIPGCVITIDGRTEELCIQTGLKMIPLSLALGAIADELVERARWTSHDANHLDATRRAQAKRFTEFLAANHLFPDQCIVRRAS